MTIDYKILVADVSSRERIEKIILDTFEEVDRIYNKYNPSSELSSLNRLPAHVQQPLSPELHNFLLFVDQMVELSEGRFDPTIEPVQKIWQESLTEHRIPDNKGIEKMASAVGWDKIHFKDGLFSKDHAETRLDLGGVAKGLCVDLLVERIQKEGHSNVFVEWGGEIRASGSHPEGRSWRIFISKPGNPAEPLEFLDLQNQAVATSGDYNQFWVVGNQTYFHILDPQTLSPLVAKEGKVTSATILAPTCAFADALATVAMMFDTEEEAKSWLDKVVEKYPKVHFRLVRREVE